MVMPREDASYEYQESLWKISFGLQKIDGLKPSNYLIELSKEEIEGNKTYSEIRASLDKHYSSERSNIENEEVDKVSVSIAEWLWKGNPFLDKITPNKNIPSKYCLSC